MLLVLFLMIEITINSQQDEIFIPTLFDTIILNQEKKNHT